MALAGPRGYQLCKVELSGESFLSQALLNFSDRLVHDNPEQGIGKRISRTGSLGCTHNPGAGRESKPGCRN